MNLTGVHHVKVPVADLAHSTQWYSRLLDLQLIREFVESGALRGVALRHRAGDFVIALREREACVSRPILTGFDPFALRVGSRKDLEVLAARCDDMGVEHQGIQDRSGEEAACDVIDPDGTVLRFIWNSGAHDELFIGVSFDQSGTPSFYDSPRLQLGDDR